MRNKIVIGLLAGCLIAAVVRVSASYRQVHGAGQATTLAPKQVAEGLKQQYGAVRFHREEELEERFIVRGSPPATVTSGPHFFRVQGERFQVSTTAVIERDSGIPALYIATSSDESKIYKLGGFPTAEQEFNRLVMEGPAQRIVSEDAATSRGLLCAEVVYGLSPDWWIEGVSSLKLQLAKHFFDEGHKDGLALAEKSWGAFKANKTALAIATTKSKEMFTVNLPILWAPVEGNILPEIRLYSIHVGEHGSCQQSTPVVYRLPRL